MGSMDLKRLKRSDEQAEPAVQSYAAGKGG